jgi:hypothetical protein
MLTCRYKKKKSGPFSYVLESARVNFIADWLREGAELEVKILLPQLEFGKVED